ncbi:IPT/TIG domain-containing protein, partial [bacterium]|nr:IPT/TIG domain-containing protein [bacterium]
MSTYTRFLLFVLSIFLLHSTLPNSGELWAQGEVITFSVTGDVPYGSGEVSEFQAIIDEHNLYSPSDFIVHVGDIKSGGGSCGESHYTQMRDMLLTSAVPAYIVIGDNEWTDCSDQDQAWAYWMTHLFEIESNFCATPPVERHPVQQDLFAFVQKGVLFIGINLVGGGNDSAILQADAEWISQQMVAKKSQVRAAVVFAQASGSGSFESDFAAASLAFGKPVLYIHGNDHGWKYKDPYLESNITRVVIDRGNEPPVHVTVAMTGENPFTFERDPWPSGTSPYNHSPCVHAGSDTTILQTELAFLQGTASDDGVPLLPGNLSYTWSKVSGPGNVNFGTPNALTTTASFSAGGMYELVLSANDGALSGYDTVSVDVQSVGPSVAISDVSVTEGNSGMVAAIFDVSMINLDGSDVTVQFSTGDISATAGADYIAQSGSLTLTNSVPSGSITVLVNGDGDYEPDEMFRVSLSTPSHGSISDGEGIGSILNDDLPAAPVIASFTPAEGPGGTEVTLTGQNFVEISSVMFNGVEALSYSVDSATQIHATVPASGSGLITVTNSGGSGSSSSPFTVLNIPNITSFSPSGGAAGTDVTITGFHFNGATEVSFNNVPGSIQSTNDTELISTVPFGATTGKIRVTNGDGTGESSSDFVVIPPPVV